MARRRGTLVQLPRRGRHHMEMCEVGEVSLLQMLLQRSHLLLQVRHVARQPGAQLQYVHRPQVQHFRCQEERLYAQSSTILMLLTGLR